MLFLLLACQGHDPPPACDAGEELGDGARMATTFVDDDPSLPAPVRIGFVTPVDPAPPLVPVLVIGGGFLPEGIPESPGRLDVRSDRTASVYFDLPEDDAWNDVRGPIARRAVAVALRYAAGLVADVDGCTIGARADTSGEPPVILGWSNGGNLAWTTLADESLDVPAPAGIVTFETPISGQIVLVEPGTTDSPSPLYVEGSCALGASGVSCHYPYPDLAFTNGSLASGDYALAALHMPSTDAWFQSTEATMAAAAQGVAMPRADSETTAAFWEDRTAPPAIARAVARFDPPAVVLGTEIDHIVTGATDHPHVALLLEALERADAGWFRLDPDAAYVDAVLGIAVDEHAANTTGIDPLLPESAETVDPFYATAAVLELADRRATGDWSADLSATLAP